LEEAAKRKAHQMNGFGKSGELSINPKFNSNYGRDLRNLSRYFGSFKDQHFQIQAIFSVLENFPNVSTDSKEHKSFNNHHIFVSRCPEDLELAFYLRQKMGLIGGSWEGSFWVSQDRSPLTKQRT
jgi:hypothetical protein